MTEFHDIDAAVFPQHGDTVHADPISQYPFAGNLEIDRINAGGVKSLGSNTVQRGGGHGGVGGLNETGFGKIGCAVNGQLERHDKDSFAL